MGPDWFSVYLIPETLRATGLGAKREGATVNLEIEAQTQVCGPVSGSTLDGLPGLLCDGDRKQCDETMSVAS